MRIIQSLTLVAALGTSAAHAADLTDLWVDDVGAGVRAVLIQHGDTLSLDLYRDMSLDGRSHLHAGAMAQVGLDASGNPVFSGTPAGGQGTISVRHLSADSIVLELDVTPPQRIVLSRTSASTQAADLGGRYVGGFQYAGRPCAAFAGTRRESDATWTLQYPNEDDQQQVFLRLVADNGQVCHFHGVQGDSGRLSHVSGEYVCKNGIEGPFELGEIERTRNTLGARMKIDVPSCGTLRVDIGGLRRPGG